MDNLGLGRDWLKPKYADRLNDFANHAHHERLWMPVRKIPKNYLLVTGAYSSQKNAVIDPFESLLEKEYMMLLDFEESVAKFESQPVRIPVLGVAKGYVPDLLVTYRSQPK